MPALQLHDTVQLDPSIDHQIFAVATINPGGTYHIESLPVPGTRWLHHVKGSSLKKVPCRCAKLHKRPDMIAMGRCSVCGRKLEKEADDGIRQ